MRCFEVFLVIKVTEAAAYSDRFDRNLSPKNPLFALFFGPGDTKENRPPEVPAACSKEGRGRSGHP
jgi:hypothetical protein